MYKTPPFILACLSALASIYSPFLVIPCLAFLAIFWYIDLYQSVDKRLVEIKKLEDRLSNVEKHLAFRGKN